MKYFQTLQSAAYHEAGHAVVAWYHNVKIKRVTISPDKDFLGRAQHRNPIEGINTAWDLSTRARLRMEYLVHVCLAGPLAQRRFSLMGFRRSHADDDCRQAGDLLNDFVVSHEEFKAYFRLLEIQTQNLLDLDYLWQRVKALAAVLLERETLSGTEVRRILENTTADI